MRYALGIEYDGSPFKGWQQLGVTGAASVQASVQTALSAVANAPVSVTCAGRTDAGVHARCQVVHFDSDAPRSARAWVLGATTALPAAVCVRWCVPVAQNFNARFSAIARRYCYRLLNRPMRPALYRHTLSWERRPLDATAMQRAAQILLGENDFSAFRSSQCQANHARRNLQSINVQRHGETIEINVQANAFLHHMVRNIVGSLVEVGVGEKPESWIAKLLAQRDRTLAGATAPPQGLVFIGPLYPAIWQLPDEVSVENE